MTQTVRKYNKSTKTVDIYSHPNNCLASIKDSEIRYTVYIQKFTLSDLKDFLENSDFYEAFPKSGYVYDAVSAFAEAKQNYIWKLYCDTDHWLEKAFFAKYEDAKDEAMSQHC